MQCKRTDLYCDALKKLENPRDSLVSDTQRQSPQGLPWYEVVIRVTTSPRKHSTGIKVNLD